MIPKEKLDALRALAREFRDLTEHGDFSDFATVARYSKLSAHLSLVAPALLDEIERLAGRSPDGRARTVTVNGRQAGRA